ncbi:MAG TPA: DinB family protein [Gemmatimonadales bacterium]|nr:DinB family protein [Gemmatimonadales bacterium]
MTTSFRLLPLALCCLASVGSAQAPKKPVSDALRDIAHRAGENLVAAAEEMPAGDYGFKPTPAQMTFGEVIMHLIGGNDFLCANTSGVAAPKRDKLAADAAKEKLVAQLRETFRFCESALAQVNDSDLGGSVPFFGKQQVSRARSMFAAAEDWADHYSQLAIYLRLKGHLPPTAKRQQE